MFTCFEQDCRKPTQLFPLRQLTRQYPQLDKQFLRETSRNFLNNSLSLQESDCLHYLLLHLRLNDFSQKIEFYDTEWRNVLHMSFQFRPSKSVLGNTIIASTHNYHLACAKSVGLVWGWSQYKHISTTKTAVIMSLTCHAPSDARRSICILFSFGVRDGHSKLDTYCRKYC